MCCGPLEISPCQLGLHLHGQISLVILRTYVLACRRLFPLTKSRTLPAIPIGSVFRLIDIPISNLLNSGINKVCRVGSFAGQAAGSMCSCAAAGAYDTPHDEGTLL